MLDGFISVMFSKNETVGCKIGYAYGEGMIIKG